MLDKNASENRFVILTLFGETAGAEKHKSDYSEFKHGFHRNVPDLYYSVRPSSSRLASCNQLSVWTQNAARRKRANIRDTRLNPALKYIFNKSYILFFCCWVIMALWWLMVTCSIKKGLFNITLNISSYAVNCSCNNSTLCRFCCCSLCSVVLLTQIRWVQHHAKVFISLHGGLHEMPNIKCLTFFPEVQTTPAAFHWSSQSQCWLPT